MNVFLCVCARSDVLIIGVGSVVGWLCCLARSRVRLFVGSLCWRRIDSAPLQPPNRVAASPIESRRLATIHPSTATHQTISQPAQPHDTTSLTSIVMTDRIPHTTRRSAATQAADSEVDRSPIDSPHDGNGGGSDTASSSSSSWFDCGNESPHEEGELPHDDAHVTSDSPLPVVGDVTPSSASSSPSTVDSALTSPMMDCGSGDTSVIGSKSHVIRDANDAATSSELSHSMSTIDEDRQIGEDEERKSAVTEKSATDHDEAKVNERSAAHSHAQRTRDATCRAACTIRC
jgi:hypothetical protein